MIPVMIITEDFRSFNYFNKIIFHNGNICCTNMIYTIGIDYDNPEAGSEVFKVFETKDIQLRNKVLELLHKAANHCFKQFEVEAYRCNGKLYIYEIINQTNFQIYISDIVKKAKKELGGKEL